MDVEYVDFAKLWEDGTQYDDVFACVVLESGSDIEANGFLEKWNSGEIDKANVDVTLTVGGIPFPARKFLERLCEVNEAMLRQKVRQLISADAKRAIDRLVEAVDTVIDKVDEVAGDIQDGTSQWLNKDGE